MKLMTFPLATASLDHILLAYVIKACRSKSKSHQFQTFVPKLIVHFTTILLIFETMNNIFTILYASLY